MTLTIIDLWTDGACSGNPGPCTAHWLWKNGTETTGQKDLGHGTNNYAELAAIGCGLSHILEILTAAGKDPAQYKIRVRCDSQTVLFWLNGTTPGQVFARDKVIRMVERIRSYLIPQFAGVVLMNIRGENNLADPGNKS